MPTSIYSATGASSYAVATTATNQVWTAWLGYDFGTSTSTTTTPLLYASGTTTASNLVWASAGWQNPSHQHAMVRHAAQAATPEQLAATEARRAQLAIEAAAAKAKQAERDAFRAASKQRARNLLSNFLTPAQKAMLSTKNFFEVTVHGKDGVDRRYRVEQGYAGNVKLLDAAGNPVKRFCIHGDSRIPEEDNMLMQKMLLEANEEDFVKIANKTCLLTGATERGRRVPA